jgi:formamidopyrimidine-DNA glycosylase
MPELPEVETVRRGLQQLVVGRFIAGVDVLNAGSFDASAPLDGARFVAARRRAKMLLLDLDDGRTMAVHLKMTGQLVVRGSEAALFDVGTGADGRELLGSPDRSSVQSGPVPETGGVSGRPGGDALAGDGWGGGHPSDSLIGELPDRSTRVVFDLDDGARLFFNDQRKFGWMKVLPRAAADELTAGLGPEPMDDGAWPEFRRRVRRHERTVIKAALLDQHVVAGIGNIYADESLWGARVHPAARVAALGDRVLRRLLEEAATVMELSIELGGSTARNYVDAEGRRGAYLDFARVFHREGQSCPRCGATIVKTRVAGRGTHLCPRCQRLPRG